jgi:hypothetical protein
MNIRDYPTLHLDTNYSKGAAGGENILHSYHVLLQAVSLLLFVSKCNVG